MILPLMLLAADPETAIDAERAFNRAAQTEGQWTAFRKFADDDAVLFTPQPEPATKAIPAKDPPIAVQWWPADSYVSCDGTVAVNTGPWVRPKAVGYFTTVWERQADGHFKWVVDGGDTLNRALAVPEKPRIYRASCKSRVDAVGYDACPTGAKCGSGMSDDLTLQWDWIVQADGARTFNVRQWDGKRFVRTLRQKVAAPK